MAKIMISLNAVNPADIPESEKFRVEVIFKHPGENACGRQMMEMMRWVKEMADRGTGIEITADAGDDKKSFYIDGDGADRIIEVVTFRG